jgi:sugar phosphate isomerase/epimerase
MDVWPVGLSTGCFYQRKILSCLETIKSGGFHLIEVCSVPTHLDYHNLPDVRLASVRIRELGMKAHSFHAPFAQRIDISSPSGSIRKNALTEIYRAAEAAAALGVEHFVIHPGPEDPSIESPQIHLERLKQTTESLFLIAEVCRQLGIRCVLENKLPHLVFARIEDLVFILDATVLVNVGICLDTGHAHVARALDGMLNMLAPFLCMLHAHDNRANSDEHLPPGEGGIDWNRFSAGLMSNYFNGPVILEIASLGDDFEIMNRAKLGKQFLQEVFQRVDLLYNPARAP